MRTAGISRKTEMTKMSFSYESNPPSGARLSSQCKPFQDPSIHFRDIHARIKQVVTELGGKVAPKLNWSAPKDATWIAATNSMECRGPSDVYLLLKSSDFITHDLEHPFDDCDDFERDYEHAETKYDLILRKWVQVNPSVEFRCFVRDKKLVAITQRDLNHFDFLFPMREQLRQQITDFFEEKLMQTFPDPSFVFDVYIPPPHDKVWLIDINPFAPTTDPLLFAWLEILTLKLPSKNGVEHGKDDQVEGGWGEDEGDDTFPELRLVKKDDPEAYSFTSPQYSAHKLPKDVVDASMQGPGPLREFADQWKQVVDRQRQEDSDED